jgi:hypothetical protein
VSRAFENADVAAERLTAKTLADGADRTVQADWFHPEKRLTAKTLADGADLTVQADWFRPLPLWSGRLVPPSTALVRQIGSALYQLCSCYS